MRRKRRRLSEESGGMVPDFGGLLLDSTADGRLGGAVAKDRLRKNRWGKIKTIELSCTSSATWTWLDFSVGILLDDRENVFDSIQFSQRGCEGVLREHDHQDTRNYPRIFKFQPIYRT